MGIDTVKHLPDLVPLMSTILREPFALGHKRLLLSTLGALQSVLLNAWPRLPAYRGAIMMGICMLWGRCVEERKKADGQDVEDVTKQVQESVAMMDAVMLATETDGLGEAWEREKRDVMQASLGYEELFAECVTKRD
jgi:hypothetical protein